MDLESITRWEDYSRAKDEMMVHTDIPEAPWYVVESDVKKRGPAQHDGPPALDAPLHRRRCRRRAARAPGPKGYKRPPREQTTYVPDHARRWAVTMDRGNVVFLVAVGVTGLHIVDDSFINVEPGTSAGDHLVSGLVPLAGLAAAAVVCPRVRAGARATIATSSWASSR